MKFVNLAINKILGSEGILNLLSGIISLKVCKIKYRGI